MLCPLLMRARGEFLNHCQKEEFLLSRLIRPYAGTGPPIRALASEHAGLQEQVDVFVTALGEVVRQGLGIARLVCDHIQQEDLVLRDLAREVRPSDEAYRAG